MLYSMSLEEQNQFIQDHICRVENSGDLGKIANEREKILKKQGPSILSDDPFDEKNNRDPSQKLKFDEELDLRAEGTCSNKGEKISTFQPRLESNPAKLTSQIFSKKKMPPKV